MLQLVPGLQGELVVKVARADALGPLMQDPDGSHNLPCRPHPGYQENAEHDDPVASHPGQELLQRRIGLIRVLPHECEPPLAAETIGRQTFSHAHGRESHERVAPAVGIVRDHGPTRLGTHNVIEQRRGHLVFFRGHQRTNQGGAVRTH